VNFRRKSFIACIVLLHLLAACGERGPTEYQLTGPTMGTRFNVNVVDDGDVDLDSLREKIQTALDDADRQMSTYRDDSELARFNRSISTDWVKVSNELCEAVHLAFQLGMMTSGAFDITVGPLVNLWGFGPDGSVSMAPAANDIELARKKTGLAHVQANCANSSIRKTNPELNIDLSGFGKGRAADDIGVLLSEHGIVNFLVEIGGDLRVQGKNAKGQAWHIAIERPDSEGRAIERIIQADNTAIATSGDYRNFFELDGRRYSHTIDPRTGKPVTHDLASVTVVLDNGAIADAYATALMVLGPDAGMSLAEQLHIAAYFLVREGDSFTERMSPAFNMLVGP